MSTDRQVSALKPATTRYERKIAGRPGLAVRVYPAGAKQFEFRYVMPDGTRRRLLLGAYPDLNLSKARAKAPVTRLSVLEGADPVGERATARVQARTGDTLNEAALGLHGGPDPAQIDFGF